MWMGTGVANCVFVRHEIERARTCVAALSEYGEGNFCYSLADRPLEIRRFEAGRRVFREYICARDSGDECPRARRKCYI